MPTMRCILRTPGEGTEPSNRPYAHGQPIQVKSGAEADMLSGYSVCDVYQRTIVIGEERMYREGA